MKYRKTNFLVTLVFDENLDFEKQIDTEHSFKNEITKDLQHLVTGKAIKHFVIADDEVINDKLKEEPVLDKIRAEIEEVQTYDGIYIDRAYVLQIIDKYRKDGGADEVNRCG